MPNELKSDVTPAENDKSSDEKKPTSEEKERSYYYDDAHGYENFDPDSEVVETEDD
jgi:hypothetical protein